VKVANYRTENGIAVTVHSPQAGNNLPVIVLCHGFCGIQPLLLPPFVSAFVQAGFAAVTFDYRGFGDSEGERGRLVPALQIDDILTVIKQVSTLPELDAARIGLWGTSFGGCHVMGAAANNPAVKAIVSQLAFADGEQVVTGSMSDDDKQAFIATLDKMYDKKLNSGKEMMVSITKVLSDAESKAFFEENKVRYPAMDIKIPFLTVRETVQYHPQDNAALVTCPTLVMVAELDGVNPPEQGVALYRAVAAEQKKLHIEPGAQHYDIYSGPHFDAIIGQQISWFNQHL